MKKLALDARQIKDIASGHGGCIASDRITVDGLPVMYMSRDQPRHEMDSGWLFLSGTEDDDYMDDADNLAVYDVNTIANFDPSIAPWLDAPIGSEFEKEDEHAPFTATNTSEQRCNWSSN